MTAAPQLRPYQAAICDQAEALLRERRSPIIQAATGAGKTVIGAEVVRRYGGRVFWGAHRIELVDQAAAALERALGERVGRIVAGYADVRRVTVFSKDSMRGRVNRGGVYEPDLIIWDEVHHSEARTYRELTERWPRALRLGLSATPWRTDGRSLTLFDSATEPYDIRRACADAWLVPIRARRVRAASVDISGVATAAGDLSASQLGDVIRAQRACDEIASGLLEHSRGPTLVFVPTVEAAYALRDTLLALGASADVVSGKTEAAARAGMFAALAESRVRYLVNVGVAAEGTDLPTVGTVAIARPTKSSILYAQMIGRGTRPAVRLAAGSDVRERRAAITASVKPDLLVLDFVGATGRHRLATAAAVFGGDSKSVTAVERRLAEAGVEVSIADELAAAEAKAAARAARVSVQPQKIRTVCTDVDIMTGDVPDSVSLDNPLLRPSVLASAAALGLTVPSTATTREIATRIALYRADARLASGKQVRFLVAQGMAAAAAAALSKHAASLQIGRMIAKWKRRG